MAKIQDKSIFGEYDKLENRITAAFLHLLRVGGEKLICYLFKNKLENFPSSEIFINTQTPNDTGVADGIIKCDFSFNIQIECKLTGCVDQNQLERYKQNRKFNDYLVYVVKEDNNQITDIPFFTWTELDTLLSEYIQTQSINDIELYLIEQFKMMLENNDLVDKYNQRVIVVAGGWGKCIAEKYHFYVCQNHRSFRRAKYLAFYHDKKIEHLYEILGEPVDDVNLMDPSFNISAEYFEKDDPNYQNSDRRKLFKLNEKNLLKCPIIHNSINENGRIGAYTQKQRYVSFNSICNAKTTNDLENMD